jgi:hypothetical protein
MDNNFEGFSEDDCSNQCLKPCEEIFYIHVIRFGGPGIRNEIRNESSTDYEGKKIIYTNNVYMTFAYFISSIGGLLGLWNNVSLYDLQLIIIKICGKIFKLKLITKLSNYFFSTKVLKLFDLIRNFVIKINLKVKNIFIY